MITKEQLTIVKRVSEFNDRPPFIMIGQCYNFFEQLKEVHGDYIQEDSWEEYFTNFPNLGISNTLPTVFPVGGLSEAELYKLFYMGYPEDYYLLSATEKADIENVHEFILTADDDILTTIINNYQDVLTKYKGACGMWVINRILGNPTGPRIAPLSVILNDMEPNIYLPAMDAIYDELRSDKNKCNALVFPISDGTKSLFYSVYDSESGTDDEQKVIRFEEFAEICEHFLHINPAKEVYNVLVREHANIMEQPYYYMLELVNAINDIKDFEGGAQVHARFRKMVRAEKYYDFETVRGVLTNMNIFLTEKAYWWLACNHASVLSANATLGVLTTWLRDYNDLIDQGYMSGDTIKLGEMIC